jgi:N-acetylglucosamine-6-phosphate deacetylase
VSLAALEVTLAADRVLTPDGELTPGWLSLSAGRIDAVGPGRPPADRPRIDLRDRILAPGFVDLHVHGGGGAQVNADSAAAARAAVGRIAAFHVTHGTTALLPTTVSDTPERTLATVAGVAAAVDDAGAARVLGVHLEGPWLSPERAGAQDRTALRAIDAAEVERLLEVAQGRLRIVTLAPEVPGGEQLIERLVAAQVIVSIGHTEADYEVTRRAVKLGARHFTHLFNAMPPLSHRRPGPVGVALTDTDVAVELIADGHHVHPAMLDIAFDQAERAILITDASAAAGLPEGAVAHLGRLEVVVAGGAVTLAADRSTLAGSALTMDAAVRTMVERTGVGLEAALKAASTTPAEAIGRPDLGRLQAGAAADLVVLDENLEVAATLVDGRALYDRDGAFTNRSSRA